MMPLEIEAESSELRLFSEVERESMTSQIVDPLPLPCFVGPLGSKHLETASQFDQQ